MPKQNTDPGVSFEIAIANLIESFHPDWDILLTNSHCAFDLYCITPEGRRIGIEVKNRVDSRKNPGPFYFDPTLDKPYDSGPPRRASTLLLDKIKYDSLLHWLDINKVDNIIILYIYTNCIAYAPITGPIKEVTHWAPTTTEYTNNNYIQKLQVDLLNPETYPITYEDIKLRYLYQSRVFEEIKITNK